jgi:hypothetical protein
MATSEESAGKIRRSDAPDRLSRRPVFRSTAKFRRAQSIGSRSGLDDGHGLAFGDDVVDLDEN